MLPILTEHGCDLIFSPLETSFIISWEGKGSYNLKTTIHTSFPDHFILSEKQSKTSWIYQGTSWRHPLNEDSRKAPECGSNMHSLQRLGKAILTLALQPDKSVKILSQLLTLSKSFKLSHLQNGNDATFLARLF